MAWPKKLRHDWEGLFKETFDNMQRIKVEVELAIQDDNARYRLGMEVVPPTNLYEAILRYVKEIEDKGWKWQYSQEEKVVYDAEANKTAEKTGERVDE